MDFDDLFDEILRRAKQRETTARVLAGLTPAEERSLRERFGFGSDMDLEEVERQFSVTRERIREIEKKALRKLKRGEARGHDYAFRPVLAADLPLIARWLTQPHVARWWSDPDDEIAKLRNNLAERGFEALIMLLNGRPVGYLQVYDASPGGAGALAGQPPGTRGLDLFIGEQEALGKGHGPAFVRLIAERCLMQRSVIRVIADPDPANLRSIRCFEKAGFVREREVQQPWGPAVLMARSKGHPGRP